MATCLEPLDKTICEALGSGALSEEQALEIYHQGSEAVVFALLEQNKQLAEAGGPQTTPSTPSGMIPVYEKPPAKPRKKRPAAKQGHPGSRRVAPERIDRRETHKSPICPDCGGRLKRTGNTRTRYVEDIPQIEPEVTEHTIHSDWCPNCRAEGARRLAECDAGQPRVGAFGLTCTTPWATRSRKSWRCSTAICN